MGDLVKQFQAVTDGIVRTAQESVKEATEEVSDEALIYIKGIGDYDDHREAKNYRKSFYLKKGSDSALRVSKFLVNRQASLTHLLENGHAIKNANGTYGRTKAYPHWKQTEEFVEGRFEEVVSGKLKEGFE